ncbi:MAG: hypothetical protein PHC75_03870 [Burkholderiales bacterium]|nr:hypothetical protein [Burkholderiales bacterium]
MKKFLLIFLLLPFIKSVFADDKFESNYIDDVVGDAPTGVTVSSAGIAFEEVQNGAQSYVYFSQTLANDIYYEARLYGKYNYLSQNPLVNVPVSNIKNPPGFGGSAFVGYNFHPTETFDVTPYLRFNYLNNMAVVYEDSNGNFMNSIGYAEMLGVRLAFKVIKDFTPTFDFRYGFQQVKVTGQMDSNYETTTGTINQSVSAVIMGFSYKVNKTWAISPYYEFITQSNSPDSTASAPYNEGGFNISPLTATLQQVGIKVGAFW